MKDGTDLPMRQRVGVDELLIGRPLLLELLERACVVDRAARLKFADMDVMDPFPVCPPDLLTGPRFHKG